MRACADFRRTDEAPAEEGLSRSSSPQEPLVNVYPVLPHAASSITEGGEVPDGGLMVAVRKVPADAPTSFVPARHADYLEKAREAGDDTGFRHYWELCVILGLRDGLRSGDIFVPASHRPGADGGQIIRSRCLR
jgi:hypothetical protein